jgi:hypothetical protein
MAKKKAKKGSAKKSLKLRKKPLRDLPAGKKATKVKGGATLLSQPTLSQPTLSQPTAIPQRTFAPPYVPVQPGLQDPRLP